jgi:rhodanese-related sulfurtransferase
VLCDATGDDLAPRAATKLAGYGYTDLAILDGGMAAWAEAGLETFIGINVPSKAFGELVEHHFGTPSVSAEELHAMLRSERPPLVLDSRPMDEYRNMNIPGAIDCPGAELVHRIHDLAPEPERPIVVNCAGRTRSIVGAQSLINAGLGGRVAALRNGAMGWHLAGFELERGSDRRPPPLSDEARATAKRRAAEVGARAGVRRIDRTTLEHWQAERDERSLYLLDVRDPDEYAAGHLPGSRPAPGGQLVQRTDEFVPMRGARIVLVDDDGVRATMTASWLNQMRWGEVVVLDDALDGVPLEEGGFAPTLAEPLPTVEELDASALAADLARGDTVVVDCATSIRYDKGHVPGAWFVVRARLPESARRLPDVDRYVVTGTDEALATFTAADLARLSGKSTAILNGGTAAWEAAGQPLETGLVNMADAADDVFWRPYDKSTDSEAAMQAYLDWEHGLIAQLERDGTIRFELMPVR